MKHILMNKAKHEMNVNGYSYVAHFATIGNHIMVVKEIGESPATVYQAIYGYGVAANIEAMQKLISECPNKSKATKMAVRGLVRGNHMEELYKIKDYRNYKADIVFGYAQAGNEEMVATMVDNNPTLFEMAVQGYASAGNEKALLDLVKGSRFYGEAISQAATAGHVGLVNQLLEAIGLSEDLSSVGDKENIRLLGFLNKALSGYCKGFHLDAVGNLLTKGANIQTALDALKVEGMPCLDAYIGLYVATPDEKSQDLLKQIETELTLADASMSDSQVETMKKLQGEYSKSGTTFVSFLSELPSEGLISGQDCLNHV
ncbi:MAG: hypothetical protein O3C19_06825 [Bacteroidetes bacterium]|nr:hypothetical protein [Bacteroidota bacterium]